MWKLVVLACLVALCASQTPTRPAISETFDSGSNVELHRHGETIFGHAQNARNPSIKEATERLEFPHNETFEVLERYDMGETFLFTANATEEHCRLRKETGDLPKFWGWVQMSMYAGKVTIKHITYDLWRYEALGTRLQVGVEESNPNIPHFYSRDAGGLLYQFEIVNFTTTAPPSGSAVYDIPKICTQTY